MRLQYLQEQHIVSVLLWVGEEDEECELPAKSSHDGDDAARGGLFR